MRRLSAIAAAVTLAVAMSGCDGGGDRPNPTLSILFPLDGAEINFDADTDTSTPGLNYDVVVFGEHLSEGDEITLTAGDTVETVEFVSNPIAFRGVDLGESTGEVTLVASSGDVESAPITVTLVREDIFCPTVDITSPADGVTLSDEHDEDPGSIGFQYTITISTNAGNGAHAELWADGRSTGDSAVVSGTVATFDGVTLSEGTHTYEVRIDGSDDSCDWPLLTITVDTDAPACSFGDLPAGDPCLNSSDDVNAAVPGMQIDVTVDTESGAAVSVELLVDGVPCSSDCEVLTSTGAADFGEIGLPDGTRRLQAHCVDESGNEAVSSVVEYEVDTVAPSLSITSPLPGAFLTEDALPENEGMQVEVCIEASAEAEGQEVEAYVPGSAPSPVYGSATVTGGLACMHVTVTARTTQIEAAAADPCGNQATARVEDLTVDTSYPDVSIGTPAHEADLCMADDSNSATRAFEHDVTACVSEPVICRLLVGATPVALDVPSTAATCTRADGSDAPYTVTFPNAVLREGDVTVTVECEDEASLGGTDSADVTIDNTPPQLEIYQPRPCGETYGTTDSPFTIAVRQDEDATVHVVASDGTEVFTGSRPSGTGFAFYGPVTLGPGTYYVWAESEDDCLNRTVTSGPPCDCTDPQCLWFEVTTAYTISIVSPADGALLGPPDDRDSEPGTFAAQVCVRSTSVAATTPLHIEVDAAEIPGSPFPFAPTDDCRDVPLTEGPHAIRAWVLDPGGDTVERTIHVTVDLTPTEPPTDLVVDVGNRRESSLHATWAAPATSAASSHVVRWSHDPIVTDSDFRDANDVSWTGGGSTPGEDIAFDLHNLIIERDYYVAVAAVDRAGNVSNFVATPTSVRPEFLTTITTTGSATKLLGDSLSGAGDLDGDGVEDMVAGSGEGARVYFGPPPASGSWSPDVSISLPGNWGMVAGVGDFNGDGHSDLAVGAPLAGTGLPGALYLFYGGPSRDWSTTTSSADADVVINGLASETFAFLGTRVAAAGDFCGTPSGGDGFMDVAVSAPAARSYQGSVFVICGAALSSATPPLVTTIDTVATTVLRIDGVHSTGTTLSFGAPGLAGLGDTNRDGRDDLGIGVGAYDSGRAYLVRGLAMGVIDAISAPSGDARGTVLVSDTSYVAAFSGEASGDRFGDSVAGMGDLNGDGNADFAVGAPGYGATDAGRVYVYQSTATGIGTGRMTIDPNWAGAAGDQFGTWVASGSAGSGLEPDRSLISFGGGVIADFLAAARYSDTGAGNLVVVLGGSGAFSPGLTWTTGDVADDPATSEHQDGVGLIVPPVAGGISSARARYVGDIDGDGWLDLAVSDVLYGESGGRVILYH